MPCFNILNLFGIEQEPVYYEPVEFHVKKHRKHRSGKETKDRTSHPNETPQNQSGWKLPSLTSVKKQKQQFSPFDIASYIVTYFIQETIPHITKAKVSHTTSPE